MLIFIINFKELTTSRLPISSILMASVMERIAYGFEQLEWLRNHPRVSPVYAWEMYLVSDGQKSDLDNHTKQPETVAHDLEIAVRFFKTMLLYGGILAYVEDFSTIPWM